MVGLESLIEEVLRTPERVVLSKSDETVRLYYRYMPETLVGGKWMCVVVKETHQDAFVLTAYLTDRTKRGEILWPKE